MLPEDGWHALWMFEEYFRSLNADIIVSLEFFL